MAETIPCRGERAREAAVRRAAEVLRAGGLVAFPTETVYGLGADATNPEAVRAIFEAKDRPPGHPLIVHVEGAERARDLVRSWPDEARELAERFWPGPLTLILAKSRLVPDHVTGGLSTVGLRCPAQPVAQELFEVADRPVAAPSANPHTRLSPTRAEHVEAGLGSAVDVILDGGPTEVGIESTVLTLAEARPTILRPGMIARRELEASIGPVEVAEGVEPGAGPRPSPGMDTTHYAPEARLRVAPRRFLRDRAERASDGVGIVWRGEAPVASEPRVVLPDDPAGYAAELYQALHRLDAAACDAIWVEAPPDEETWRAIRDRLRRAADD